MAYEIVDNPRIAVEVLIGHGKCHIIAETSVNLKLEEVEKAVKRISQEDNIIIDSVEVPQDVNLANNQSGRIKCGDNGIFKGVPLTYEQRKLAQIARDIYEKYPYDGKYIINNDDLVICQSNAKTEDLKKIYTNVAINPLGEWTGGVNVDSGATNRKLGSDMADSVTGGGLHGKDLSKADVSLNIYAWLKAQTENKPVELCCAIGDTIVDGKSYEEIVDIARKYIKKKGGFEKFAEWGLV